MRSHDLVKDLITILDRSGFATSEFKGPGEVSINLVSRRGDLLLLIKVIMAREEISRNISRNMVNLTRVLKGSPMIVVPSTPSLPYQDGVLYVRYGIPLLTFNTLFDHLIEEVPPLIYHGSGGFFVTLDGSLLRNRREMMKISLGALADAVGISRKAVQMYEAGMGADMEVALMMEKYLQTQLILPMDPFFYDDELQSIRDGIDTFHGMKKEVMEHLDSIGMEVIPTQRCPFDALVRDRDELLLASVGVGPRGIKSRARDLNCISRITGGDSLVVVSDSVEARRIDGTPIIKVSELKSTEDPTALIKLIRERA
ncbi:MAG: helix-turn-helix domain-containing protein [Candidatus Thermoplasmatota archaeon]|nr:helix-turn-helix domain-containing protein [Candidatus Thermoplasmatota archaeon]